MRPSFSAICRVPPALMIPAMPLRSRLPVAARLSLFYGALFSVIGFHMPYWPVWLEAQGMTAADIGTLLAAMLWAKVIGNPVFGRLVDSTGRRRGIMIGLSAASIAGFALFVPAQGFWMLLGLSVFTGASLWALMPLGENLTLLTVYERKGLDYGRIRLWGSVTFIAGSVLGGRLLQSLEADVILWAILAGVALTFLSCLLLPEVRSDRDKAETQAQTGPTPPVTRLLRHPAFVLFLVSGSVIQASHAVYYGFATLDWRAAGLSGDMIGLLWAVGVVAEVALFAFGNRVVAAVGGPAPLILLGAAGGLVRWTVLGLTAEPLILMPVQALHALTFGATHLGAMHFIARAVPTAWSGRAQALYSSLGLGVAMGLAMGAAGWLYDLAGGTAYLAMTALALVGLVSAAALRTRWDGGVLSVDSKA